MPPKGKPEDEGINLSPDVYHECMERIFWLEALFMALGAAAETRRTKTDLPHMVSRLSDLGTQLAGETSTLLMDAKDNEDDKRRI